MLIHFLDKNMDVSDTRKRVHFLSHPLRKLSFLIFFPNGDSMNCSDIYITSLIPYSYKSPAGKVYVGVLSVLQTSLQIALVSHCLLSVFQLSLSSDETSHRGPRNVQYVVKKMRKIKTVRAGEIYHQNKRKLIE